MILIHDSTLDLADQDASVVPGGAAYLHDLERRLAPYFERTEPRQRTMAYLRGLLSAAERKNSWQLAEVSGDATPYAFQHLLRRALWDPEAVRDELRRYLIHQLEDPEAVLVIDETGFLKKAATRPGWRANTAGRPAALKMVKLGCLWAMPVGWATPCWIANSTCPKNGPTIPPAVGRRASQRFVGLRPSRSWLSTCCGGRSRPACPPAGSPATASTGMTGGCGCGWRANRKPTCWQSRAKSMSGWAGGNDESPRCWPVCRSTAGPG
jgi:DDE superfamily endonuclease